MIRKVIKLFEISKSPSFPSQIRVTIVSKLVENIGDIIKFIFNNLVFLLFKGFKVFNYNETNVLLRGYGDEKYSI